MGDQMMTELTPLAGFLISMIRLAVPLLLAASGELITEKSGVLNLSLEGMMLTGALCGFIGNYFSGSIVIGYVTGILGAMLLALIFAFFTVSLRAPQVIIALGINLFASGLTGYLYRLIFGLSNSTPKIDPAPSVHIPVLSDLPGIGKVLFYHPVLIYVSVFLVILIWWFIYKTPNGLILRATGENARAVNTVGMNVIRIRYLAVVIGGGFSGLAGAYLSTTNLNVFMENMTGGNGWIAVAIVIFGNYQPFGILFAAIAFGAAQAGQLRLQNLGLNIPKEFLIMIPYLLTLFSLCVFGRWSKAPKELCIPYSKDNQ